MFGYALSKWSKRLIPLLIVLAGCLPDNGPIVQVVPRVVLAPQNPRFQAIDFSAPASGSMLVKWNRSIADTQLNFKGYFVKLYKVDSTQNVDLSNSIPIATAQIVRSGRLLPDSTHLFTQTTLGPTIPLGDYGVVIFGVKANDSSSLSTDSSEYFGLFDPRPLTNPTNLRATSLGPTQIGLCWTPSPTEKDSGFFRYVIYYRDTTKNDTGRVIATNQKQSPVIDSGVTINWNDSTAIVSVPGVTPQNGTTSEWPYQFWVKSERNDSTFFYPGDTNSETWAGAQNLTSPGADSGSGVWGGFHNSIFIGSFNQAWAIVDDSNRTDKQVTVTIDANNKTVTLTDTNGCFFLDDGTGTARMDTTYSLGSIYYKYPYATPSDFRVQSVTLPATATSTGIVLYLMIPDPLVGNPEWARLFISRQKDGTFINSSGGIHCDASFQPALSNDGSKHLPYY
jgi:hypothetical protein